MSIYSGLKAAEEMGIDREYAINRRRSFLTDELFAINDNLIWWSDFLQGDINEITLYVVGSEVDDLIQSKIDILNELDVIKRMVENPKTKITDDMIENARNYPIDRLIEFNHKKALAWCHEDRRPSLCHMNRINKVWCPVCDEYFDTIAVLMKRDGMSFIDAVERLN